MTPSLLLFLLLLSPLHAAPPPCTSSSSPHTLYILVMDSRKEKSLFQYMTPWMLSTARLKSSPLVKMIHVGSQWETRSASKFLAKPTKYLQTLRAAKKREIEEEKKDPKDVFVMLLDSDIFWSNPTVEEVFQKYECIREGRDLVVSTELNCWLGRFCNKKDVQQLYHTTPNAYSVFVNSGAMMGTIESVEDLLVNITKSKEMYFIENSVGRRKYDDQFAVSVYALERPSSVALDVHQRLFATYTMLDHRTNASDKKNKNWPFVCRNSDKEDGEILMKCADRTTRSFKSGSIFFDENTCAVRRSAKKAKGYSIFPVADTLDDNPVLWHGNGAGKRIFYKHSEKMKSCYLRKLGIDESLFKCGSSGCVDTGKPNAEPIVLSNTHLPIPS